MNPVSVLCVLRREVLTRLSASWRNISERLSRMDPIRLVIMGYASYAMAGWLLLCLPWSQRGSAVGALDHLFIAVSAISTTGLVTVSPADTYTGFGQAVLLLLIQLGGLGYMTIGSFTVLALSGRLSTLRRRVGSVALSLPEGFQVLPFIRLIAVFTLVIEGIGAVALFAIFAGQGTPQAVWLAVFHSVSAFCTAGFGLFNDSFESFRGDLALNATIATLSYLGAIGFIVPADVWDFVRRRKNGLTLTSKIILTSTVWIGVAGTGLFLLAEPASVGLPYGERWLVAFFQVMTASTTVGFNTVPIAQLSHATLLLLTLVMIVGASPSGTGGGIKTTSFTALWAVMTSVIRRREQVTFLGRVIPDHRLRAAMAHGLFYCITLAAGLYALALFEDAPLADQAFECISALGTVGLSRGLTATLTVPGKIIILLLMFAGRVGPAVFGMAFFIRSDSSEPPPCRCEDVAV